MHSAARDGFRVPRCHRNSRELQSLYYYYGLEIATVQRAKWLRSPVAAVVMTMQPLPSTKRPVPQILPAPSLSQRTQCFSHHQRALGSAARKRRTSNASFIRPREDDVHVRSSVQKCYISVAGFCVSSSPKRFLIVTRCRENLSSGEKRAAHNRKQRDR